MINRRLPQYKNLEDFILTSFNSGLNSLILTLPGLGLSHLLSQISTSNNLNYINEPNQTIANYNILDFDANKRTDFTKIVDFYFRQKIKQFNGAVFVTIINTPSALDHIPLSESFFVNHSYRQYYFSCRNPQELNDFLIENNFSKLKSQFNQIYSLSAGIPRLAKYLAANPKLLQETPQTISQDANLIRLITPTIKEISNLPPSQRQLFQLPPSPLLDLFISQLPATPILDLSFTPTLILLENQAKNPNSFTSVEIKILKFLLSHPLATRQDIADLKWGAASYDKYSDQAINTTIARINQKLLHHHIESLPKIGYSLLPKEALTKPSAITTNTGL